MTACLHCGMSAPSHFANCPTGLTLVGERGPELHRTVTEDDAPICGPARLNDRLDRLAQQLYERCR